MKRLTIVLALVLALSALTACGNKNEALVETGVGEVTATNVIDRLKQLPRANKMLTQVVQQLAMEQMLADKYDVSEDAIKAEIESYKKKLPEGLKLEDVLKRNNLSMEEYKDIVKTNLLVKKARKEGLDLSDKTLKQFFEKNKESFVQVKAMHVLVDDKETAQKVYNKAKNGTDFAKLVETYAVKKVKQNGGKLGWFGKGKMLKPFWQAAYKLKPGEVSKPVKTKYGYHVIKVLDKKDTYKELKDTVKARYVKQKGKPLSEVFNNLLEEYDIEVNDKAFEKVFQPKKMPKNPKQGSTPKPSQNQEQKKGSGEKDKQSNQDKQNKE